MSFIRDFALPYTAKKFLHWEDEKKEDEEGDGDGTGAGFPAPDKALCYGAYTDSPLSLKEESGFLDMQEDVLGEIQYGHDIAAAVAIFYDTMMAPDMLERINRVREAADLPAIGETIDLLHEGEEIDDHLPGNVPVDRRKNARPDTHDR